MMLDKAQLFWDRQCRSIDFHVLMTLLSRFWTVLAGAITLVILPIGLNPSQQGYYFTFANLLALQIFLELGLSQIIVQLISHETAHLKRDDLGRWVGPDIHIARLGALQKFFNRWYSAAALAFVVLVGFAGWIFFNLRSTDSSIDWLGPWLIVVLAAGLNLWSNPGLATNEGLGNVGQVARIRLIQSVIGYSLLWLGLVSGIGLWCSVAVPLCSGLISWYWLRSKGRIPRWSEQQNASRSLNWRAEIFPLQWRIAVSWISGYLIFNVFTPLAFSVWGAQEAGRLGMALLVFSSITTLGMSWVNAKFPVMSQHVARRERVVLNQLFQTSMWQALAFNTLGSASFIILVVVLGHFDVLWVNRIASLEILIVLAVVCIVNTLVFSLASYMRAHQKEPMLPVSLVSAFLTIASMLILQTSIFHMMLGYAAICLFVTLPWTIILYKTYLRPNEPNR
jgi:hypothetical protein